MPPNDRVARKEDQMAKNVDRVPRIIEAASRLIEIEASYSAGKGAKGAAAAKRELKAAYEDYVQNHARELA
jgi:hypothetical protein